MKTKHTNGQWKIEHSKIKGAEYIMIRSDAVKLDNIGRKFSIAKVQFQTVWQDPYISNVGRKISEVQIGREQAIANANLIASAPDNLQEHFNCIELLQSLQPLIDPERYPVIFSQITEQVNKSEAIIKKATT